MYHIPYIIYHISHITYHIIIIQLSYIYGSDILKNSRVFGTWQFDDFGGCQDLQGQKSVKQHGGEVAQKALM